MLQTQTYKYFKTGIFQRINFNLKCNGSYIHGLVISKHVMRYVY